VLAAPGQAVWATDTDGQDVARAEVQTDGNFVLYTPDKPVWHTDTEGAKDVRLLLQDDRNLVLYGFDGPAWASNTQTGEAPPPPPPPPAVRTDTVVSGDTLWAISERFYGDGSRYQQIANASGISNPDLIHPGQVLTIP
jgi:nucleoid-associated protein YgaU